MKKHIFIEAILMIAILGISFWNIQQQQENVSLRKSEAVQEEKQKELKQRQEELLQENEHLSAEAESSSETLKRVRNEVSSGVDVDSNSEFINVVTKLFEANLNFTPENYADKKKEVASYLSEELNKEYFGQNRNTYQDANDTTSRLESLEVYSNLSQSHEVEGIVVVYYRSTQNEHSSKKGMNIFRILCDIEYQKVVKIENLGSGYSEQEKNK